MEGGGGLEEDGWGLPFQPFSLLHDPHPRGRKEPAYLPTPPCLPTMPYSAGTPALPLPTTPAVPGGGEVLLYLHHSHCSAGGLAGEEACLYVPPLPSQNT